MPELRRVERGDGFEAWEVDLHGHQVVYRIAGSGPPVVLVHGMVNSSRHWRPVAMRLAERHTVIAPDLIGHGDSATPRGDYSLGAHATVIRDLLSALGIEPRHDGRALARRRRRDGLLLAVPAPRRAARRWSPAAGSGPRSRPLLRSVALPGAAALISLAGADRVTGGLERAGAALRERGSGLGVQLQAIARALRPLGGPGAREAFVHTLRAVIDARGQRVGATDRLYLLEAVPTLIAWGERDRTIPIEHGRAAHAAVPHSRFVTLPGAAHFPHIEAPEALAATLLDWIAQTEPATLDDAAWHDLLRRRAAVRPRAA